MDVVGDLLARDRRSRDLALVTPDGRERTYHDLITNAYKAANVLRYLGVREGTTVAVDPSPGFHTALAFLGAAGLGAPVRFDPATGIARGDRVVLVDVDDESATEPAPGTNLVVFGGSPERPETTHWEQELWSENPATPPSTVDPSDPVVRGASKDADVSHRDLLAAAASVVVEYDLAAGTRVVLRGDLSDPRALAAGVVAPLAAGATTVLEGETGDTAGEAGVVDGEAGVVVDGPSVSVEPSDGASDQRSVDLPEFGGR